MYTHHDVDNMCAIIGRFAGHGGSCDESKCSTVTVHGGPRFQMTFCIQSENPSPSSESITTLIDRGATNETRRHSVHHTLLLHDGERLKCKHVVLNPAGRGLAVVVQRVQDPIDARETRIKHDLAFVPLVRSAYPIDATRMKYA